MKKLTKIMAVLMVAMMMLALAACGTKKPAEDTSITFTDMMGHEVKLE